jgi:hypothetical protein
MQRQGIHDHESRVRNMLTSLALLPATVMLSNGGILRPPVGRACTGSLSLPQPNGATVGRWRLTVHVSLAVVGTSDGNSVHTSMQRIMSKRFFSIQLLMLFVSNTRQLYLCWKRGITVVCLPVHKREPSLYIAN